MSGKDITLWWGDGSPPCWSIQVALEEKQIQDYTSNKRSFDNKDNKSAEILAINPRGELPCFRVGDVMINESLAACLYLEEAYPNQGTALMPRDVTERAMVWQKVSEFYWNFPRRGYKNLVRYIWWTPKDELDAKRIAAAKEEFLVELQIWEAYLKNKTSCKFLVGNSLTIADVVAFPWMAFLFRFGLKLRPRFECLAEYCDHMKEWPSMKKFYPQHWDGSPASGGDVLTDL